MPQFSYGTAVNNQPNYLVDMDVSAPLAANRDSFNGAMTAGGGLMGSGTAAQSQATTQQVDPNQLMSTHLNALTDRNGAYVGNARERAREFMSGRGGGNGSFAAGAAERAAIDAAAPIASFDAGRFGRVADLNQQYENQHSLANASNQTQLDNTALSGNLQNRNALTQMLLGQDFTAMNDIRRQLFGIEDREDHQAFSAGQFGAGLDLDYARLAQGDRQFYSGLNEEARQFNQDYGLRRDMFGEDQYRFNQTLPLDWARLSVQERQGWLNAMAPIYASIGQNPELPADQIPNIFGNATDYMSAGYNNFQPSFQPPPWVQSWFQNPPQSVGHGAAGAAAGLPPMGP